jgi:hypothetical protein
VTRRPPFSTDLFSGQAKYNVSGEIILPRVELGVVIRRVFP